MQPPPVLENIAAVLLDIEGTLCPISFVRETLFPYAIDALGPILSTGWNDPAFESYKEAFPKSAQSSPQAFEAHVRDLTARDVKIGYLKDLQGYLWEDGYKTGKFATPFYSDVRLQLESWEAAGLRLSVYSSGSIHAQKLIFGYTDDELRNDYSGLIGNWFDTNNAGPKTDASSYDRIVQCLGQEAGSVLFLTDNVKEAAAASEAGLHVVLLDRRGNAALTEQDHERFAIVTTLEDINLSAARAGHRFWK